MSVFNKIKRRSGELCRSFKQNKTFSFRYAVLCLMDELFLGLRLRKISNFFHRKKDSWIMRYLRIILADTLNSYRDVDDYGFSEENEPIWVCWWTGIETAPPLVQQCVTSIKKNSGNHIVNVITAKNYTEYLELPICIFEKVETRQIGLAHLADYIRVTLLEKYGGLWLDATIFCTREIPEDCFNAPFFTFKSPETESRYLSKYRWTTFCLGGKKSNVVFKYLKAAFECYWTNNSVAIDYLFFDHLIELGYQQIPAIKQLIDDVPENNLHRDDLQMAMNVRKPANEFEKIIDADTVFYKLSWRETYELTTITGEKSVYQRFLSLE